MINSPSTSSRMIRLLRRLRRLCPADSVGLRWTTRPTVECRREAVRRLPACWTGIDSSRAHWPMLLWCQMICSVPSRRATERSLMTTRLLPFRQRHPAASWRQITLSSRLPSGRRRDTSGPWYSRIISCSTNLIHSISFTFRYVRFIQTPNTLRSKLQEKLISGFDTNELAGTIASIQITPSTGATSSTKPPLDDSSGTGDSETALPPIQPGSRKSSTVRRSSRGGGGEDGPTDKIDIDSENIETPPVTRRAYGSRPFAGGSSVTTTSTVSAPPSGTAETSSNTTKNSKPEDDELGDGRFDRFSSIRRTRRLRKAPEGAEEECANLEPRKSPEGVEDPDEADHRSSTSIKKSSSSIQPGDVIVGMEVKKVRFGNFYDLNHQTPSQGSLYLVLHWVHLSPILSLKLSQARHSFTPYLHHFLASSFA